MKAAVYRRYGSPGVVSVADVPRPAPRDDEVLVRIHAATLGGSPTRTGTSRAGTSKATSSSR